MVLRNRALGDPLALPSPDLRWPAENATFAIFDAVAVLLQVRQQMRPGTRLYAVPIAVIAGLTNGHLPSGEILTVRGATLAEKACR